MTVHDPEHMHQDVAPAAGPQDDWRRVCLRSEAEAFRAVETLEAEMNALGYPDWDVFAVRIALMEAVVNALWHGHGGDPSKCVRLRYLLSAEQVTAEVMDEGPGFVPERVPDPLGPQNLGRPGGWGLLLMRSFMTWVRFNGRGNSVTLYRRRSYSGPGEKESGPAKERDPARARALALAQKAIVSCRSVPDGGS
jgi:serine/threonine-protein kinase RsbW